MPGLDPPTGDVTYTEELLRNPPPGVAYETYEDALAAGRLVEHARRGSPGRDRSVLGTWRIVHQAVLNRIRRTGLLWREPFRYFSVQPGSYDLVHVHVFSARWVGDTPPVVLSNGAPQPDLYRDGYGWSARRVAIAWYLERVLAWLFRVDQPVCRIARADAVVTFTDHLRQFYLDHGLVPAERVHTIPCPTEARPRPTLTRAPTTVGFVARNFEAKGGPAVLAAWPLVRAVHPRARLLLAGADLSHLNVSGQEGVETLGPLSRERLMSDFFAEIDVFAYPTTFDGGSLVMQEALAHAIPIVTSDYGPMPEMIGQGKAGAVVAGRNVQALADEISTLLSPDDHRAVSARTADWFDSRFATAVVVGALGRLYCRLVEDSRRGTS